MFAVAGFGALRHCADPVNRGQQTYVVRAANHFEPVAKNDLGSPILASFAAIDGTFIIRTRDELLCVGRK